MKMVVVVLLPRMLWRAGVFELNRNASLLIARERADDWLLGKDSGDKQQLQQQKRLSAHEAPNHATGSKKITEYLKTLTGSFPHSLASAASLARTFGGERRE